MNKWYNGYMNDIKVSVVVPMYNVQTYIEQCLDCFVCQTLTSLQVILVDDGSTDQTCQLVKKYVDLYPDRFQLVHKENGGLSDARNFGLQFVRGQYLSFLDSDDFVEPTLYEKLANLMDKGFDIVVTDIEYYYESPSKRFIMKGLSDWKTDSIQKQALLSPMFAWNKMYRTSFFLEQNVQYPKGLWYEDIPVTTLLFAKSKSIGYLNEALIHYRQREGSIMSSIQSPRVEEIFTILQMVRAQFQKHQIYELYRDELEYLHIEHLCLYGMFRFIRSPYLSKMKKKVKITMQSFFPNYLKNPYLIHLNWKNRLFLGYYYKGFSWLFNLLIR